MLQLNEASGDISEELPMTKSIRCPHSLYFGRFGCVSDSSSPRDS
jgi:hypothetical protein